MSYLAHHGVLGMKWGVRRYQNKDGSLTDAGWKKYGGKIKRTRAKAEKEYQKSHKNIRGYMVDQKHQDVYVNGKRMSRYQTHTTKGKNKTQTEITMDMLRNVAVGEKRTYKIVSNKEKKLISSVKLDEKDRRKIEQYIYNESRKRRNLQLLNKQMLEQQQQSEQLNRQQQLVLLNQQHHHMHMMGAF